MSVGRTRELSALEALVERAREPAGAHRDPGRASAQPARLFAEERSPAGVDA
jgi:hypothetical protein